MSLHRVQSNNEKHRDGEDGAQTVARPEDCRSTAQSSDAGTCCDGVDRCPMGCLKCSSQMTNKEGPSCEFLLVRRNEMRRSQIAGDEKLWDDCLTLEEESSMNAPMRREVLGACMSESWSRSFPRRSVRPTAGDTLASSGCPHSWTE